MTVKFEGTEETMRLMPTLRESLETLAFAQANEFLTAGQSAREATSIVANLMIHTAWVVAASGAVCEGVDPDKDKFRACVENVLDIIQYKAKT